MKFISVVVLCLAAVCIDARSPPRPPPPPPPVPPTPPAARKICDNCLERRFMQHYVSKGCLAVKRGECINDCVERYMCPEAKPVPYGGDNYDKCEFNRKFYSVGDQVEVGNPCKASCYCAEAYNPEGSTKARPTIQCVDVECPEQVFGRKPYREEDIHSAEDLMRLSSTCYFKYEVDGCCAGEAVCPTDNATQCTYKGGNYKLGQLIWPSPCKKCVCDEKWNEDNLRASTCKPVACDLDLKIDDLRRGCAPVYHESYCCPIDYECPAEKPVSARSDSPPQPGPQPVIRRVEPFCTFGDNRYALGQMFKPKPCVDCTCKVPPELTCMKQDCPQAPGPNCVIEGRDRDACCPKYNCTSLIVEPIEPADGSTD